MDVAVTELRANLARWLSIARDGEEIVVTDRGTPVARLVGVEATSTIERLTAQGVIGRPAATRVPQARGRTKVRAKRPLADRVSEQRR